MLPGVSDVQPSWEPLLMVIASQSFSFLSLPIPKTDTVMANPRCPGWLFEFQPSHRRFKK